MSFSYNEKLKLEVNNEVEVAVKLIEPSKITETIMNVMKKAVSLTMLKDEFNLLQQVSPFEVTDEHIKNAFIISCNGVELVWNQLTSEQPELEEYKEAPLYENVFSILEEMVDGVDFKSIFEKELTILNTKETWG